MGGTERKGSWTPARKMRAVAMMGGIDLDFREARFGPSVTELDTFVMIGAIEILAHRPSRRV